MKIKTKCVFCNREAFVHYGFSRPLCKEHFKKQIEARVKKELRVSGLIDYKKMGLLRDVILLKENDFNFFTTEKIIKPILKDAKIEYKIISLNKHTGYEEIKNAIYKLKKNRKQNKMDNKKQSEDKKKIKNKLKKTIRENGTFIIIPKTNDYFVLEFLLAITEEKNPCFMKLNTENIITLFPLKHVLETESLLYATINKYKPADYVYKEVRDEVNRIISLMQKNKIINDKILREMDDNIIKAEYKRDAKRKKLSLFLDSIEEKHPGTKFSTMKSYAFLCEEHRRE